MDTVCTQRQATVWHGPVAVAATSIITTDQVRRLRVLACLSGSCPDPVLVLPAKRCYGGPCTASASAVETTVEPIDSDVTT